MNRDRDSIAVSKFFSIFHEMYCIHSNGTSSRNHLRDTTRIVRMAFFDIRSGGYINTYCLVLLFLNLQIATYHVQCSQRM